MGKLWLLFKKRPFLQGLAALVQNPFLLNLPKGVIYQGAGKGFCVPGLNCYSCPAAAGACPLGALQAVLGDRKFSFSYYAAGILILFGVIFGRLICGFLCPFGFLQDLLHKIPAPKGRLAPAIDRPLRALKYIILAVFVVALPLLFSDAFGNGEPYFCKLICPAGTLEGGVPLLLTNASLRAMVGALFTWKAALLMLFIAAAVLLYRPFCKYVCPLGAIYGFFNKYSFYRLQVDAAKCTSCKACERQCKMGVRITRDINSAECIRCGACISNCEEGAIHVERRQKTAPRPENQ